MSWRDEVEAALNAVVGDYLDARGSDLTIKMGLYHRGRPLEALPRGTSRLCVLIHGMACTEKSWTYPEDPELDYGSLLERERGLTPLYVRYNTGLPIRNNGQQLAVLLDQVVANSPVSVKEITLIGHSLGGLVIRSACQQGVGQAWFPLVKRAFYLGSPHLGSPLEKAGHVATSILKAIDDPVVQMLGDLAEIRSAAVKDLRHGDLVDTGETVPLDDRIEHFLAAGSLPEPFAALLGDGVVRVGSATGARGTPGTDDNKVGLFPGLHHMALLHHHDVYAWIAERCGPADPSTPVEPRVGSPQRSGRLSAYLELAEDAVARGSTLVQGVHEAMADRAYDVLDAIPPVQAPSRAVRAVHFRILRGTYATVRLVNGLVGAALSAASDDENP